MSGEIDAGHIGSIVVRQIKGEYQATQECPELPAAFQSVKLDRPIWVQNNLSEIQTTLGKPSLKVGDWLHYHSEQKLKLHGEEFYESGLLSVRFVNERVVELWVSRTTSN
jgi:hypothetical protein